MLYLVTFAYPNATHNRTETFADESKAYAFFSSIVEDLDSEICRIPERAMKRAIFLTYLDGYTAQVRHHYGNRDLAHAYPETRLSTNP